MRYLVNGVSVTPRVPTLAELSACKRGGAGREALKGLCQSVMTPDQYREIKRCAPAAFEHIGLSVCEDAGLGAPITLLDEDELVDSMASAYVEQQAKSAQLYRDESDPRRKLYPITCSAGGVSLELILRPAQDAEIDEYRKGTQYFEQAKKLVHKLVVVGSLDGVEEHAPGLYLQIAEFALDQAGDFQAKRLGE